MNRYNQLTTSQIQQNNIKTLVSKVMQSTADWGKHIKHQCCKCQKCTCGKHLCKIQSIHLPTKMGKSTYNQDYNEKKRLKSQITNKPQQVLHPNKIIDKSAYKFDYTEKKIDIGSPIQKLKGNLQLGGPLFSKTTYNQTFKCQTPTKPQQLLKNIGYLGTTGMRLKTSSHYQETYKWNHNPEVQTPIKKPDNLKTQTGAYNLYSSYQKDFIKHKPKKDPLGSFAPKNKYIPTSNTKPSKSAYANDYNLKEPSKCPAQYIP